MNFPYKGKKVLIFGLGVLGGGVGVAKFFAEAGAKVTVTDLKSQEELQSSLSKLKKYNIEFVLGKHREEDFKKHDLIVKNPAIPWNSPFIQIAKAAKVPIEMEASLFFKLTPSKKIIGITGTKGKTTTTLLIGEILKQAGFQTVIGGIPQKSIIAQIPKITPNTWAVLELSSWQLESLKFNKSSPHIAVLTNIFYDHLNYYKTLADYIASKKIIFEFQSKNDYFITSQDFEITKKIAKEAKSKVFFFSKKSIPNTIKRHLKLVGEHNILNAAAAFQVAKILRVSNKTISKVFAKFKLPAHHLETVTKISGVTFINDTTATIPEAAIGAISSIKKPIILLAGGADKNLDFAEFGKTVNQKVKGVVLLEGTATDKIEKEVDKKKILGRFSNFKKAVKVAFKNAEKGEVVLLSPACASFGMFKNEFNRGESFRKIVGELDN